MTRFFSPRGRGSVILRLFRAGVLWSALWLLFHIPLSGQSSPGTGCDVPHFDRLTNLALSNGTRVTFFSAPVIVCAGGTRITADSAVVYEASNYTQLFRNVVFQDADSRLTADRANYFDQDNRLRAWGDVVLNDLAEGSVIRGDTMVLLRGGSDREKDRLTVTGRRPQATLYPTPQPVPVEGASPTADSIGAELPQSDSAGVEPLTPDSAGVPSLRPDSLGRPVFSPELTGPPLPRQDSTGISPVPPAPLEERVPWDIDARRIFLEGSRYFRATGDVNIHRESVDAVADSVEYDGQAGSLFLARDARLTTSGFDLSAGDIRLEIPQDEIRGIEARHESFLVGEDLQLLAPTIIMFLTEGELDRLVARRDSALDLLPEETLAERPPHEGARNLGFSVFPIRPHAFAQDFLLWGDSVDVAAPGGRLEEVKAMGQARGESLTEDSLNTEETSPLIRRDWLEGDTIIAFFSQVEAALDPEGGEVRDAPPEISPPPALERRDALEAPQDSGGDYRLERLVARGKARSLYRMAPSDSTMVEEENRLAIHYVIGDEITILMDGGEVDRMEVKGETRGIHLEPVKPPGRGGVVDPDTAGVAGPPGGRRQ